MNADIAAHLSEIIAGIRRLRSSIYPADWTADPWYQVEKELETLLDHIQS